MRPLFIGFIFIFFSCTLAYPEARLSAPNPQLTLVGARGMALDATNPTLLNELSSVFINPAVIAPIDKMQISVSNQKLFGSLEKLLINACFPYNDISFGISFGSSMLYGIPETTYTENRIREIDSFSSGYHIFQGTVSKRFYDFMNMGHLSIGTNIKYYNHLVKADSQAAVGLDLGGLLEMDLKHPWFDRVYLAGSFLNLYATPFSWTGYSDTSDLQKNFFLGVGASAFNRKLNISAQNTLDQRISFSVEGILSDYLYLRASVAPELNQLSSIFQKYSVGTGIQFDHISGFGDDQYALRLDYAYIHYAEPMESEPTHIVTFSLLGESQLSRPKILSPKHGFITRELSTTLQGEGPLNAKILLYNNGFLARTISPDINGKWEIVNFPLKAGANHIYFKSFSLQKETSFSSEAITIYSDNLAPTLSFSSLPNDEGLDIQIQAGEALQNVEGRFNNNAIRFTKMSDTLWTASVKIPIALSLEPTDKQVLTISGTDLAGNTATITESPFMMILKQPKDQMVSYLDTVVFNGVCSKMVSELLINNQPISLDLDSSFVVSLPLQLGKNTFNLKIMTFNHKFLEQNVRILKLKTFRDIQGIPEQKTIEALLTLNLLPFTSTSNLFFNPDAVISRAEAVQILIQLFNILTPFEITQDLPLDIDKNSPIALSVQAIIQARLILPYPDNKFYPDQPMPYTDLLVLFINQGLLPKETVMPAERKPATRKDFASLLALCPKYQQQIQDLLSF